MAFVVREGFYQQLPGFGHLAAIGLHLKPLAHFVGKAGPAWPVSQHLSHAARQMRGQRQPRTHIAWDVGRGLGGGADDKVKVFDRFHLQRHSGKGEAVSGAERGRKRFFDPAQFAAIAETDLKHGCVDDDTCVESMLRRKLRVRQSPPTVGFFHELFEAVVGLQRVSAGGDKGDDARKGCGV